MAERLVQGFSFEALEPSDDDNQLICQIVRRAEVSDVEILEVGPAFLVEFGDGHRRVAYSKELHPWYAT